MAVSSPDQLDVNGLISQMQAAQDCSTVSYSDSRRLLRAARNLVISLEKPANTLVAIAKGPVAHAALRVALKIRLFDKFDTEKATLEELSQRCGVDPLLMARIMRTLLCIGIFDEDGEETYIQNVLSKPFRNPTARAMFRGMAETTNIMPKLPDYLASLNYRNPDDRHHSFFSFAEQTDLNMYEWLQGHPEQLEIFNNFQTANAQLNEGSLQRVFKSLLVPDTGLATNLGQSEQNNDKVLFVDVGGGRAESLRTFRRNHPELEGRIVVEDLPKVVEGQGSTGGVESVAHDFFNPQPVKGMQHLLSTGPSKLSISNFQTFQSTLGFLNFSSPRLLYEFLEIQTLLTATELTEPSRSKHLLLPLRPPQLARQRLPRNPPPHHSRHDTRIQTHCQRHAPSDHQRRPSRVSLGHPDDCLRRHGAYREAMAGIA